MMEEPTNLRFVLLEHRAADGMHWDLMIEASPDAPLRTWRLLHDFRTRVEPICVTPIGDHRRVYLNFEGELSEGRGFVRRVEQGAARWLVEDSNEVCVRLEGERFGGVLRIRRSQAGGWVLQRE